MAKKQKQNQLAELQNSIAENENGYGLLKKKTERYKISFKWINGKMFNPINIISTR